MLQWFIGAFDDTADSAALVQAPVGNENVIKPRGIRANIGTKSFGVACKHLVGSASHLPRSFPGAAPLLWYLCTRVREGDYAFSIKSDKCSKTLRTDKC